MTVQGYIPTLGTVIITAAIDSINPCAIGVLILLASIMVVYKSRKELLIYGMIYIFFVYLTYLLAGLGILYFLSVIPIKISVCARDGIARASKSPDPTQLNRLIGIHGFSCRNHPFNIL